jgi:hypothetical protein
MQDKNIDRILLYVPILKPILQKAGLVGEAVVVGVGVPKSRAAAAHESMLSMAERVSSLHAWHSVIRQRGTIGRLTAAIVSSSTLADGPFAWVGTRRFACRSPRCAIANGSKL